LLPGFQIGEVFVSIDYSTKNSKDGRTRYQWSIDGLSKEYIGDDLQSGCDGGTLQEGLESLISFLSAVGESYPHGENVNLFPSEISKWAHENQDELSILGCEIENEGCIQENC
jgi:hypothetical protein